MGWKTGFDSGKGMNFSFLHRVQTGCGYHPVFYTVGSGGSLNGYKAAGAEADKLRPCSADIKNALGYMSTLPCDFTTWFLIKHQRQDVLLNTVLLYFR
jgi:hypothetical protein